MDASWLDSIGADDYEAPDTGDAWEQYRDDVTRIASEEGVDPQLVEAIIRAESGGKVLARSGKGAAGIMQLMPATAKAMGVKNLDDPVDNIRGGTRYIKKMLDRHKGDVELALASYNAGPGNVKKYGGIPPFKETQDYIKKVGKYYSKKRPKPFHETRKLDDLNPDTQMPQGSFEEAPQLARNE